MLWVEQDSSHGQIVTWQDDPIVVPRGGAAPGMGEPLLNVSCKSSNKLVGMRLLVNESAVACLDLVWTGAYIER